MRIMVKDILSITLLGEIINKRILASSLSEYDLSSLFTSLSKQRNIKSMEHILIEKVRLI